MSTPALLVPEVVEFPSSLGSMVTMYSQYCLPFSVAAFL